MDDPIDFEMIRARARKLREVDTKGDFTFNKPYSMEEIEKFEEIYDLRLPIVFRRLITEVARSITRPYGLTSDIFTTSHISDIYHEKDRYNPGLEFPLTMRAYAGDREYDIFYPYETEFLSFEEFDYPGYTNGHIAVLYLGCGHSFFIVVKGKEYNNIWADCASSNDDFFPLFEEEQDKKRISFEEWILKRLNLAIKDREK
ncbi:MAG: hypothetical protein H6581_22935 [Bacteroidia bacterium]|nr:hypothetical protein [Bacteroidia bacterium]